METIVTLVKQILQMFLLGAVGFALFRRKKISAEGSRALGNILIYISLPAVIISSFLVERTPENLSGMLWSTAGAAVLLLVSILVSRLFFRKDAVAAFAGAFSNPGFFGVPLIIASVGQEAVFYVAGFIAFLNIGQWTYGVSILNGQPLRRGLTAGKLIRAPFVIAVLTGLLLFLTQLRLPSVLRSGLTAAASLNTPLSMFTVGIYLAQTDLPAMLRRRKLYLISLARLVVIPLISLLLLTPLPGSMNGLKTALLLACACPVGSNVAVYAQLHGKDYPYAVETVAVSTLLSIVTIPAVIRLAEAIWR